MTYIEVKPTNCDGCRHLMAELKLRDYYLFDQCEIRGSITDRMVRKNDKFGCQCRSKA